MGSLAELTAKFHAVWPLLDERITGLGATLDFHNGLLVTRAVRRLHARRQSGPPTRENNEGP